MYEPLPPVAVKSIEPSEPPLHVVLVTEELNDILHVAVWNNCCDVHPDVFVPAASQIALTCHLYNVPVDKPVNDKLFVFVVSNIHVLDEFSLYLTR